MSNPPVRIIDIVTVVALFLGPLLAVTTQLWFEKRRGKRNQKLWVFSNLMANRRFILAVDFIRALNLTDVVFYDNQKIQERYKKVLSQMLRPEWEQVPIPDIVQEQARDSIAELLAEMAIDLKFSYDHTQIKECAYSPKLLFLKEELSLTIQQRLAAVLKGEEALPVTLREQEKQPVLSKVFMSPPSALRPPTK